MKIATIFKRNLTEKKGVTLEKLMNIEMCNKTQEIKRRQCTSLHVVLCILLYVVLGSSNQKCLKKKTHANAYRKYMSD